MNASELRAEAVLLSTYVLRNWRTKVLAVLLAFLGWLYAYRGSEREVRKIRALLSLKDVPESVAVIECTNSSVALTVRGSRYDLDRLREESVSVSVPAPVGEDVKKVVTKNLPIRPDEIRGLPSGVVVEEIAPSFVPVIFDEKIRVLLPVKVVTDGQPARGYTLTGEPTAFPSQVWVRGPRSVLGKAAFVETERVNIHGLARDERYPSVRVAAALPDPERNQPVPVMAEQESVAVQVRVTPEVEEQSLSLNVLVLSPPDYPYRLELYEKEIKVRVKAPKGVMTKETLSAVAAFVDARTVEPKAPVKADVKLYLPAGVVLAEGPLPQVTIDKVVEK